MEKRSGPAEARAGPSQSSSQAAGPAAEGPVERQRLVVSLAARLVGRQASAGPGAGCNAVAGGGLGKWSDPLKARVGSSQSSSQTAGAATEVTVERLRLPLSMAVWFVERDVPARPEVGCGAEARGRLEERRCPAEARAASSQPSSQAAAGRGGGPGGAADVNGPGLAGAST